MLLAGNKSISEYNLSKKPILEETQRNLDTTYKRAVELKENLLTAKNIIGNFFLYNISVILYNEKLFNS